MKINLTKENRQHFFRFVKKTQKCWIWIRGRTRGGYGKTRVNGKEVYTHRLSYEIYKGEIPKGLYVCHRCDNPPCVRPSHLFVGTMRDNILDASSKGRMPYGENHHRSKLTDLQVLWIREHAVRISQNKTNYQELAATFKVHPNTIYGILKNREWRHLL